MIVRTLASALFERKDNVNDVSDMTTRQLGMSFATTWASGPSVFLGVFFMWKYGVVPGTAWMVCNVLTLLLAGAFWTYVPLAREWVKISLFTLPLFLMYAVMECLIFLINLGAIKAIFDGKGLIERISILSFTSSATAAYIAAAVGAAIVVLIHRYGFRGSAVSDVWQYVIQMLAAVLFAALAVWFSNPSALSPELFAPGGSDWMILGMAGMITGAFSYAQMWERLAAVRHQDAIKVAAWGALFFGVYMVCIWIFAFFATKNVILSWIAIVIILTIATSTIDSSVAGLQFIAAKLRLPAWCGSIVALGVVISFLVVPQSGINDIWNLMASIRWQVVAIAVSVTILLQCVVWMRRASTKTET